MDSASGGVTKKSDHRLPWLACYSKRGVRDGSMRRKECKVIFEVTFKNGCTTPNLSLDFMCIDAIHPLVGKCIVAS